MNKELLLRVADIIEQHPASYDQETWVSLADWREYYDRDLDGAWEEVSVCGTHACIAGHAALAGDEHIKLIVARRGWGMDPDILDAQFVKFSKDGTSWERADAQSEGQDLLELSNDEANFLFDGNWRPVEGMTVPDTLRQIAETGTMQGVIETYDDYNCTRIRYTAYDGTSYVDEEYEDETLLY